MKGLMEMTKKEVERELKDYEYDLEKLRHMKLHYKELLIEVANNKIKELKEELALTVKQSK